MEGEGTPVKLGKYELSETLGEGSIGITYRSRDPILDRPVAIKVLHAKLTTGPDFIERFRREARQAASLRHPNIVTVLDVGEQDGCYYLVMDYLPGGSLTILLQDGKPLSLSRTIEILRPIAEALDYAHSRNIVHSDLQPSNVMMSAENLPVLTDFGLLRAVATKGVAAPGSVLGKSEYLAPEQIQGNPTLPATDLYSLGIIAFQMMAGKVPYSSANPIDVYKMHLTQPPPDIRSFNQAFPKNLADVLQRALAKDPAKRYASAGEFINILDQVVTQMGQEQMRVLYQNAREQMRLLKFDAAIASLNQVLAIRSSTEVETLLQECQRRKVICDEVQNLREQLSHSQTRLNQILSTEQWLSTLAPNSTKGKGLFGKR